MPSHWRYLLLPAVVLVGLSGGFLDGRVSTKRASGRAPRTYVAYFYKRDEAAPRGAFLVPAVFPLPEGAYGTEPLRLAFQALCDKPPSGLHSAVKQGCRVGSARVGPDGALIVDFTSGAVFQPAGTTGDSMVVQQLAMTASQFSTPRMKVAYQGHVPTDLGSHGVGNNFQITSRSQVFLVTPPVAAGQRVETGSLAPGSSAVRNATRAFTPPLLGVINRRLSELGRTDHLVKEVEQIIPSGDGSLWVKVPHSPGFYRIWWTGKEWQVDGL